MIYLIILLIVIAYGLLKYSGLSIFLVKYRLNNMSDITFMIAYSNEDVVRRFYYKYDPINYKVLNTRKLI